MRYAQRGGYTPAEQQRRERLRLEAELRKGPLAQGFAHDQRWTLGRVKTLIGRLLHVGYTIEGTSKLLRRHGWTPQVPVRQAMERDDEAVAVWKDPPDQRLPRRYRPQTRPPVNRGPASRDLRHLPPARDPSVTSGKTGHWRYAVRGS